MPVFSSGKTAELRRETIAPLLKLDEASLFRNLSDPWRFPTGGLAFAIGAAGIVARRTAAEFRRDSRQRIEDHRRAARDLGEWAARAIDPEQRAKVERT